MQNNKRKGFGKMKNERRKAYMKKQLGLNKSTDNEISYQELIKIAKSYHLDISKCKTKKQLIEIIFNSEYSDRFVTDYENRFMVPVFELAKVYKITSLQFNKMKDLGVIKERYEDRNFVSKQSDDFSARCFEISSLDYDPTWIQEMVDKLEQNDIDIRLEIKNESLIHTVSNSIQDTFDSVTEPKIYPASKKKRSFYVYMHAKIKEV